MYIGICIFLEYIYVCVCVYIHSKKFCNWRTVCGTYLNKINPFIQRVGGIVLQLRQGPYMSSTLGIEYIGVT